MSDRLRAVHAAVLAAGTDGAMLSQIRAAVVELGLSDKVVADLVHRAKLLGLLKQLLPRGPYTAVQGAEPPALTLIDRALAVVADCPGGVSDQVLAGELGMTVNKVQRLMFRAVDAGHVLRTHMPKAHGGGKGYAMPQLAVSADSAAAVLADPVGAFELLDQNRLVMAWEGTRIVLSPEVTRGLFRYLDALGGLHTEQLLQPAPQREAASCA